MSIYVMVAINMNHSSALELLGLAGIDGSCVTDMLPVPCKCRSGVSACRIKRSQGKR